MVDVNFLPKNPASMLKTTIFSKFSCVLWGISLLLPANPAGAEDQYTLRLGSQQGDLTEVTTRITHAGQLSIDDPEENSGPRQLPLNVEARLEFAERHTGKEKPQAIRVYSSESRATIQISNGSRVTQLSPANRYVVTRVAERGPVRMASLEDVLTQDELELITSPADPLTFPGLLDRPEVALGDEWAAPDEGLASFLGVDGIYENGVRLKLASIERNVAKIHLSGDARAEVDDVTSELTVTGTILVDLADQQVVSVRGLIRQNREIGQIGPGFEGTTKIDVRIERAKSIEALSNEAIAARTHSTRIERRLKWVSEEGGFVLRYDPRWHLIASETEAAVFRFLDQGSLLAQCNVVQLPNRPAEQPLKLEAFREEVSKIIAKEESARVVDAETRRTEQGMTALKVTVAGIEQQVPVHWLYYHLADSQGRQLSFVFTLESAVIDQFVPADRQLVESFEFLGEGEAVSAAERPSTPETGPRR